MITGTIVNALMTAQMVAVGIWYRFDVFTRSPPFIFFAAMFMVGQVFIKMAFMFSTLVQTRNQAFTVNFCVILCSMVMQIVLSEPTIIKKVFFNLDMPIWVNFITKAFYLMPCF